MAIVNTIFGESIDDSLVFRLHSSYGHWQYISAFAFDNRDSNEFKKVTNAYYYDESQQSWQRDYFLKSDCVRFHRNPWNEGNTYFANISLSHTVSIPYDGKTFYFMSHNHRFNAGYVYSLDESRWLDLKVNDKHLFGNLVVIRREDDGNDYVANRYGNNFDSSIHIDAMTTTTMSQCPTKRFRLHYTLGHSNLVWDAYNEQWISKDEARRYILVDEQLNEFEFWIGTRTAMRLRRLDTIALMTQDGRRFSIPFEQTIYNGNIYITLESATRRGYVNQECPNCGRNLNNHDANACARSNHRNPRYDYHRDFNAKEIMMPSKVVFKVGVEIEKQSYLGSKHSNVEIGRRFGWKKERDGSLCNVIGYELVSPCYPLFSDDLINEAKEIEEAFPNLINGNDHDLISYDKSNSSCGGHIHFSRSYTTAKDTFEMISGYMPLIYAIYRKRSESYYCIAKEKKSMKQSNEKMQAVRIIEDIVSPRIEFRIFPLVKNITQLQWRIDLLRIMANNPSNRFTDIANMLSDVDSDLYKHMLKEFSPSKIKQRSLDAIEMCKRFDMDFRNFDFSNIEDAIRSI